MHYFHYILPLHHHSMYKFHALGNFSIYSICIVFLCFFLFLHHVIYLILLQVNVCWQIFALENISFVLPEVDSSLCCLWMPTKFNNRNSDAKDTRLLWYFAKFGWYLVQERVCSVIFSGATSLYPLSLWKLSSFIFWSNLLFCIVLLKKCRYHCRNWVMFGKAYKKRIRNN